MLNILRHPLTRDLDIDDPRTTDLRRRIIRQKLFLQRIYEDWYSWIAGNIPPGYGGVLELGSGAGFLDEYIPGLMTTEVFFCPFVRLVMDGCAMPFEGGSLKAIVMVDVFHHIHHVASFLSEASRCLAPGGKILMVEPWVTTWSTFVYKLLHHEPLDTAAPQWSFPASGPLSGANSALPWIVFERDRGFFESRYPGLAIELITVDKPLVYLLSGGLAYRDFMPGFAYPFWRFIDKILVLLCRRSGMFANIILTRGV